jgi:hypothetical protein
MSLERQVIDAPLEGIVLRYATVNRDGAMAVFAQKFAIS